MPDLGRTVSHSITPGRGQIELDENDLKLKDSLAKNSFLGVDQKVLSQMRQQGRTPHLKAPMDPMMSASKQGSYS